MNKFLLATAVFLSTSNAYADSVILMIGDGMGYNHIDCTANRQNLFLKTLSASRRVRTASADNPITDSAASATAYACGVKTNNGYLGINPKQEKCKTIAEQAVQQGKDVYIISTDMETGATPSAFYTHTNSRYNSEAITEYREKAAEKMHISLNVPSVYDATKKLLEELKNSSNSYFVMIEEAYIDKCSHEKNLDCMENALINFDKAVQAVYDFSATHSDVHVFVTADHETGGLTPECRYMINNHTLRDVPLYAKTDLIPDSESIENTVLYDLMRQALQK